MGAPPGGFDWQELPDGSIRITHHGKPATTLRGGRAAEFLADVGTDQASDTAQELMARLTGNYKRGNERMGKNHPRNRAR